jgi:uncharacterized membrane protein
LGGRQQVEEKAWKKAFETGEERTFEQDPKYAIRLLGKLCSAPRKALVSSG